MRALITRPEEDAAPLADALAAKGVSVTVEPLLAIRVLDDVPVDLQGVQAILFTSANGVRALAARTQTRDIGVLTVGDGTAAAARAAGFIHVESAGGDVSDLVRLVVDRLDPAGGPLFHAAGSVVAGDLAGRLAEAGFALRRVVLYEARPAESLSPELLQALAGRDIDLVLFFSPRTAATFVELVRKAADPRLAGGLAKATALCLSPAVPDAASALDWKALRSAERPDLEGMLRLVDTAVGAGAQGEVPRGPEPAAPPFDTGAAPVSGRIPDTPPAPPEERGQAPHAAPIPPREAGGVLVPAAAAAIVAALVTIIGLATEPLWRPVLSGILPAPATDGMTDDRFAALDAQSQELAQRIAALDGIVQQLDARGAGAGTDMADLAGQIEALQRANAGLREDLDALAAAPAEAAPAEAAIPEAIAALPEEVASLQSRIDEIAATAQSGPAPETQAALDGLRRQLEALQSTAASFDAWIGTIQSRLDTLPALERRVEEIEQASSTAEDRATDNAALAIAVNQLQSALAAQRPYESELASIARLAADDPQGAPMQAALETLQDRAESGVPTLVDLRQSFPAVARETVAAARAQNAADAVSPGGDGGAAAEGEPGWLDAAMLKLSDLVSVRPVGEDVEGDDAASRVARAEALLAKGDLAGAVAELDGLDGRARDAAEPWLVEARARLDAEAAMAELQNLAVSRLGAPATDDSPAPTSSTPAGPTPTSPTADGG